MRLLLIIAKGSEIAKRNLIEIEQNLRIFLFFPGSNWYNNTFTQTVCLVFSGQCLINAVDNQTTCGLLYDILNKRRLPFAPSD